MTMLYGIEAKKYQHKQYTSCACIQAQVYKQKHNN